MGKPSDPEDSMDERVNFSHMGALGPSFRCRPALGPLRNLLRFSHIGGSWDLVTGNHQPPRCSIAFLRAGSCLGHVIPPSPADSLLLLGCISLLAPYGFVVVLDAVA